MAEAPADPNKFTQAVSAFRKRVPIVKADWEELEAREKEFAFTVAGVAQIDPIADVWRALDKAISEGTDFDEFKADVGDTLAREWGGEIPGRISTIFRTNLQGAYGAGRHAIYSAPAVKEARPFLRFDAIHDDRTDEDCEAADGTTLPQDDPFWDRMTPPAHFSCRCVLTPISQAEADDDGGPDREGPDIEGDEDFGARPSTDGEDWAPDPSEYPPDLRPFLP
jgi:SPP1 gp7 family putative phage head morphogenesis protein